MCSHVLFQPVSCTKLRADVFPCPSLAAIGLLNACFNGRDGLVVQVFRTQLLHRFQCNAHRVVRRGVLALPESVTL